MINSFLRGLSLLAKGLQPLAIEWLNDKRKITLCQTSYPTLLALTFACDIHQTA
ncbi:MAG: hypothetical protein KME29_16140 [Calothrix sp. FI2-JRJ7]|nr:hypothetical protein [Calothrix sp. FI2-JRJ7]